VLLSTPVLIGITVLFSWLLVAEIPMFSLKFRNMSWQNNKVQYIFICCAVLLMANLGLYGIAATVLLFVAISVFLSLAKK
jgi:CDP-diacylglycerol--serine O-phosphatidyltransferase